MKRFFGMYEKNNILCVFDLQNQKNKYMKVSEIMQQDYNNAINVFFTPNALGYRRINETNTIRRANEHLQTFESLYCDIDFKLSDYDLEPEEVIVSMAELWEDAESELIEPTMIVFSGHGLHLYWKLESISYRGNIEKWELAQEYIYRSLKSFGADRTVTKDRVRVLRMADTINRKEDCYDAKAEVKVFTGRTYNLENIVEKFDLSADLDKIYADLRKNNTKKFKKNTKKSTKKSAKKKKNKAIVYTNFNSNADRTYTKLYNARLRDLEKLALNRREGTRELILFLYRNFLELATGNKELALEKALELNRKTPEPLAEREVIKVAKNRTEYKYATNTLIDLLGVTEEEMNTLHLESIVSADIKAERRKAQNKARYEKQVGMSKADKVQERRLKLAILLEQGKTEQEILEILEISRRTYFTDKKVVTSEEWLQQYQKEIQKAISEVSLAEGQAELVLLENVVARETSRLDKVYIVLKKYLEPPEEELLKVPI